MENHVKMSSVSIFLFFSF